MSAKKPYTSTKELCIFTNAPSISANRALCLCQRALCLRKRAIYFRKEPYVCIPGPYISSRKALNLRRKRSPNYACRTDANKPYVSAENVTRSPKRAL